MINLLRIAQNISRPPVVTIYPGGEGADIDSSHISSLPVQQIPLSRLERNEPLEKMNRPESKKVISELIESIRSGEAIEPIVVVYQSPKYLIVDGHHRFTAYQQLGIPTISAIVVPQDLVRYSDISYQD